MKVSKNLKIGWSKKDITPYGRTVSLAGMGNMKVTSEIRDSIYVTALVIDGENDQFALVSCDFLNVPYFIMKEVREKLADLKGFNPENIIISAIHTHTAPYTDSSGPSKLWGAYFDFSDEFVGDIMNPREFSDSIVENITGAITDAWTNRAEGGVAFELAYPGVAFSRRSAYKDGSSIMYGGSGIKGFSGFEDASDPGVELMFTFDSGAKVTGVVANIACPSQAIELSLAISADYMGEARRLLKEDHDIYLLGQIAPAGDQSPRDMLRQKWKKSSNYFSRDHHDDAHMKEMGRRLAEAIGLRMKAAAKSIEWALPVSAGCSHIDLPLFEVTQEQYDEAKVIYDALNLVLSQSNNVFTKEQRQIYMKYAGIYNRYHLQQRSDKLSIEIVALRIGDAAFISNPFELYTTYGMQIKGLSAADQTFCVQLANGNSGYLPSQRAVDGGSYGAQPYSCLVGPEGGDELVEKSLEIINKLFEK